MTEPVIECPVCLEPTTNILDNTCNHPLCLECMGHMKSNSKVFSPTGIKVVDCPLCRIKSKPSYEELEARCRVLTVQPVQPVQPLFALAPAYQNIGQAMAAARAQVRYFAPARVGSDFYMRQQALDQVQARTYLAAQAILCPEGRYYPLRQKCQGNLGRCNKNTQRRCQERGCTVFLIHKKACRDCFSCSDFCRYYLPS